MTEPKEPNRSTTAKGKASKTNRGAIERQGELRRNQAGVAGLPTSCGRTRDTDRGGSASAPPHKLLVRRRKRAVSDIGMKKGPSRSRGQ